MLSFLTYVDLTEAKVDDLAAKYPDHADAIRSYNDIDPTSTKKFLPWLVKQHIAGNVTPNDARIHTTLANFDKFAHKLPNGKDHNAYDYNTLASHVGENVEATLKKEKGKNAVERVYNDPKSGVTAQDIKHPDAAKSLYGGGATRTGKKGCERGTSWCVAARGDRNMYGFYGPKMYTIHDPNDDAAPYAVHPMNFQRGVVVTNRHNNGDIPAERFLQDNPHLKGPIEAIIKHSGYQINNYLNSESPEEVRGALSHPMVAVQHLIKAMDHPDASVRAQAVSHPKTPPQVIDKGLEDEDYGVRKAAASNPIISNEQREKALADPNGEVVRSAITNPNTTADQLMRASNTKDDYVRSAILRHPNLTDEIRDHILADRSIVANRAEAMKNPKATPQELMQGLKDSEPEVRRQAVRHPNLTPQHIMQALNDADPDVQRWAASHANNTPETLHHALTTDTSQYQNAARAAASHPNMSAENLNTALQSQDRITREFAARHANATPEHIQKAMQDSDENVRHEAVSNPNTSVEVIRKALENDPNPRVRATAIRKLLDRDPENAAEHVQVAFKDPHESVHVEIADHRSLSPDQIGELAKTVRPYGSDRLLNNPNLKSSHLLTLINRPELYGWAKENAAKHKKADSAVINAALDQPVEDGYEVRRGAMKNKNATPEHIARGLQDPFKQVRITALKNKNASAENLTQGLQDRLPTVRMQALKHPNITPDHIRMAANDKDKNVRAFAQSLLMKK